MCQFAILRPRNFQKMTAYFVCVSATSKYNSPNQPKQHQHCSMAIKRCSMAIRHCSMAMEHCYMAIESCSIAIAHRSMAIEQCFMAIVVV